MSGIAELLVNLGYQVSGSDARTTDITRRLAGMGVRVHEGHAGDNIGDADVVVVTSAARQDNPEIVEARRRGVPVIARAEMLAELMRLRRTGIAIGGAHGKTTTTSMVALMLERAGLDPTAVIGGRLSAFGSNARLGQGDVIVAEADESDGSFLKLSPVISVITNVDREHLDHYGTFEAALDAFVAFANKVPFDGAVIVGVDDPVLAGLMPRMTRRVVTYATDNDDGHARRARHRHGSRHVDVRGLASCRRTATARPSASARWCCTCRAATTCATRSRRSVSGSNSDCPSIASRRAWRSSAARSGDCRSWANAPACSSSTTTGTTRPRLPP